MKNMDVLRCMLHHISLKLELFHNRKNALYNEKNKIISGMLLLHGH